MKTEPGDRNNKKNELEIIIISPRLDTMMTMKFETILQSHCSAGNDANMFDPCVLQFPASVYLEVYRTSKGVMMTLVCT